MPPYNSPVFFKGCHSFYFIIKLRFTTTFQKELTVIKDVWKYLPQKICGGQTFVARGSNESCWNGKEMQK